MSYRLYVCLFQANCWFIFHVFSFLSDLFIHSVCVCTIIQVQIRGGRQEERVAWALLRFKYTIESGNFREVFCCFICPSISQFFFSAL